MLLRFSLLPLHTYGWCQAQLLHPLQYPARETVSSATEPEKQYKKVGTEMHAQLLQLRTASYAPRHSLFTSPLHSILLISFKLNK